MVKNTRNQQVRGGVALPPKLRTMQSATLPSLSRETILQSNSQDLTRHQAGMKTIKLVQPEHESTLNKAQVILLSQLLTNDRTTLYSTPLEAWKTAPLPVCSSIATTPCKNMCSDLQTHVMRQARIEVIAAYALNHLKLRVLKLSKLLQDFVYLRQDPRNPALPRFLNSAIAAIIARAANIIALVGTVLYNAIKEYHDDRTRKIIYFHSYTIETIHANHIKNSRSNVTVPDDYHDNDVNNILMKCTDNKRQRYNTLIEDYNRAGKREDNILTIDECRTGYSNEEDIEADEREEETRVRLRKSSEEIHDILLREFREANDFTESVTHNDDEQELELEDCDALVERYEEEINCSNLYSTV
ncbi:hypothetical protein HBI83_248390 [Parastagonospora nodorum]|nr:hypothetical protein HBI83_248390 [Parastagonospora nodorum]